MARQDRKDLDHSKSSTPHKRKAKDEKKFRKTMERPPDRAAVLESRRVKKMATSVDAYIRGNTQKFYEWLSTLEPGTIPNGPPVWICGDCHAGNLGPLADDQGEVHIQIRDFDQSVIGNPAHDLIRLGLSFASAARSSDFPGGLTVKMIESLMEGYEQAFKPTSEFSPKLPSAIKLVMKKAMRREWKQLAHERTDGTKPILPRNKKLWSLPARERQAIKRLFQEPTISELPVQLEHREDDGKVTVLDATYWRKGCSSLGKLRYAVLLDVNGETLDEEDFCLMDIKEAASSVAPAARGVRMPRDHGLRVLEAARHLSPALGERMRAAHLLGRPVVIRELMPQDLKLELSHMREKDAKELAFFFAQVVGRAHARQLDRKKCEAWAEELRHRHPRSGNVPGWLWSNVVALMAHHEQGYLNHCYQEARRSHANTKQV